MPRSALTCALLLVLPLAAPADEKPQPTETVIRLTVQPAAAPKPALRYQLLPELKEVTPGNPIQGYLKCFCEAKYFFYDKESVENTDKYQALPLKELAELKLERYGGNALRQADLAARMENPDWQILEILKKDGINTLLPDLQPMRMLAAGLKVRFRAQIAAKHFDDALGTAKTMFALSRHVGEHPTLVGSLVGIAIANIPLGTLDEMIQQPGCPNLYWALTTLPDPFIDQRKGMQGDRIWALAAFALVDETAPMSEEQMTRAKEKFAQMMVYQGSGVKQEMEDWLKEHLKDEAYLEAARKRLVDSGIAEKVVKKFPPLQVIALEQIRDFEVQRDEGMKWASLPYWQAEAGMLAWNPDKDKDHRLAALLFPALLKVRRAQARLDQRLALLRHVEAIRMYAAEHNGKLPAQLADVTLPLPADPMTGKPFVYKLDKDTAIVRGTPPKGEEKNAAYNVRYEVTIAK